MKNEINTHFDSSKQKIWFTSDTHFGHSAIIGYCGRPFSSAEEMNETIIERWNSVVGPDDIVFHLGDFVFGGSGVFENVINRLNGKIYLVLGNHDRKNIRPAYKDKFEFVGQQLFIQIDDQQIYLNHIPFLCFDGCYRTDRRTWQLHGHVHTSKYKNLGKDFEMVETAFPTQYDVGVDLNDFTPISFEDVKKCIEYQIDNNVNEIYWIDHNISDIK